jgi:hypothetical protein
MTIVETVEEHTGGVHAGNGGLRTVESDGVLVFAFELGA